MKTAICSALAGAALLASAAAAGAAEPVKLSDAQLDNVTASGFAAATSNATAFGDLVSDTVAITDAFVVDNVLAVAQGQAQALAISTFFGASAFVSNTAAATLP